MSDRYLTCRTCGNTFLYTVRAQRADRLAQRPQPAQCPGCLALDTLTVRHAGTLTRYNRSRGFGFIRDDDGQTVFVHASELGARRGMAPTMGTRLTYYVEQSERGPRACGVRPEEH